MATTKKMNIALIINAVGNAKRELDKAENGLNKVVKKVSLARRGFIKLGSAIKGAAMGMKTHLVGGLAMAGGIGVLGKTAEDFDKIIASISTMTKKSFSEVRDTWGKEVKRISAETGTSLEDVGAGFFEGLSRQVKETDIVKFVTIANRAAVAGETKVKTIIASVKPILNVYKKDGMDITKVTNMMFAAFEKGAFRIDELADAQAQVADKAAKMNIPYNELLGTFSALTQQLGRGSASQVSTMMSAFIGAFSRQGGVRLEKINKQLKAAGKSTIDFTTDIIREKGLMGSVRHLDKALRDAGFSGAAYDKALINILGRKEAQEFVLKMQTQMEATAKATDYIKNSTKDGLMGKNFDKQMKARTFKKMKIQLQLLSIQIGKVLLPVISNLFKKIVPIIKSFSTWAQKNPETVKQIGSLIVIIAALKIGIGLLGVGISGLLAHPVAAIMLGIGAAVVSTTGQFPALQKALDKVLWTLIGIANYTDKKGAKSADKWLGMGSGTAGKVFEKAYEKGGKKVVTGGSDYMVEGDEFAGKKQTASEMERMRKLRGKVELSAQAKKMREQYKTLRDAGLTAKGAQYAIQKDQAQKVLHDHSKVNVIINNNISATGDGSTPQQISAAQKKVSTANADNLAKRIKEINRKAKGKKM